MAELPDPTVWEAQALILGVGGLWAFWGLAVMAAGNSIGLVPFFVGFACGLWFYFGGVLHVAHRLSQRPERQGLLGRVSGRAPIMLPAYFRRAARVLGWNPTIVIVVLAALLASDLAVFGWLIALDS